MVKGIDDRVYTGEWLFKENQRPPDLLVIVHYLICLYHYLTILYSSVVCYLTSYSGGNTRVVPTLEKISDIWTKRPIQQWGSVWKEYLNSMTKNEFKEWRMRGITEIARNRTIASRGYFKIEDLLRQSKLSLFGNGLSLCCGRGGWEQNLCKYDNIQSIKCITLGPGMGHQGHEAYTSIPFLGKEKVQLRYGDARLEQPGNFNFILFDGGESDPDEHREAMRAHALLEDCVKKHMRANIDFIMKILRPDFGPTIELLEEIQEITGKGALFRSNQSRTTTMELYFVSVQKLNVRRSARNLLHFMISAAISRTGKRITTDEFSEMDVSHEPDVGFELDTPNYERSVRELGPSIPEAGRHFNHYRSRGIFVGGITGSRSQPPMEVIPKILGRVFHEMKDVRDWKITDTTPAGFSRVFLKKVDCRPQEDHPYIESLEHGYEWVKNYFMDKGFRNTPLSHEELDHGLNKKGAAATYESLKDVREYFEHPDFEKNMMREEKDLINGQSRWLIFSTMGKREKKKSQIGTAGSRMISFLPIPTRVIEAKYLARLDELTKPSMNRAGVGGLGLHDVGMRLNELWKEAGISDDIAGWDTRFSATMRKLECKFVSDMTPDLHAKKIIKKLYEVYLNPLLLIPVESTYVRSELVQGRGQRMSGERPTYSMNTISRILVAAVMISEALGSPIEEVLELIFEDNDELAMICSGDDLVITGKTEIIKKIARGYPILNDMGMIRKDVPLLQPSVVHRDISKVEFCSHRYEKVSYWDERTGRKVYRYMPTRSPREIIGKLCNWLGKRGDVDGELAWLSAQGNNLLVNYHHIRLVRLIAMQIKDVVPPNLILDDEGPVWRATPWMRAGDILEITNDVLFGESTKYPVMDFRVEQIGHLGYLNLKSETILNNFDRTETVIIRNYKKDLLRSTTSWSHFYGGDMFFIPRLRLFHTP
uniref:RNA-dependent RNA polymerase n=1 Tax=Hemipteran jingmen-related virus TaxID=2822571 RepID=A0A8A6RT49_9FLAV|nr:RNA-dependent RNA polymerase [Hemipteran jingmen-related virus]